MLAWMALSAMGATITFTPQEVHNVAGSADVNTLSREGVKISCISADFTRTNHYRFYAFSTTTFSSTVGRITKVEITCTGTPGNSHAPDLFSGEGYTFAPYGYLGTWTGLADSFSLYASAQVRATKIVVTIEDPITGDVVPPVFYPSGAEFSDSLEVALYCPTAGAQIHYIEGTNENDFDWSTHAVYSEPFVLKNTKTLTAWATLDSQQSDYVTATFTRVKPTVTAPEFDPGSSIFSTTIDVNITCADSTLAIYYSFDQEQWMEYTGPLTIDTDANVYAKAVFDDPVFGPVDSEVVMATYTKVDGGDGYPVVLGYYEDPYFETPTPYTVVRPGVAFTVSNGIIKGGYRIYKNENIIFTASQGKIKKIKFICTDYGSLDHGPGGLTLDEGQDGTYIAPTGPYYYSNGNIGIWMGNAQQVRFSTSLGQLRCTSIVVYLDSEPTSQQVIAPVIDPAVDTIYVFSQEVKLSCATPGATIYYGTDCENWTQYTAPFNVTEDCTIYAYAELDGILSAVSLYRFKMAPLLDKIALANELREHTRFGFTGEAIVTYQRNGNTWIKDDSGYGLIYDESLPELPQGTVIKAGWDAEKVIYYDTSEFTDAHNIEPTGEVVTVTPNEYTSVTRDNMHEYVLMKNQSLQSITNYYGHFWMNPDSTYFYDRFSLGDQIVIEEGKKYDILGIVGINKVFEIYIISVNEAVEWALGDVNHDGDIDVVDVTTMISYILGNVPDDFYLTEANVDADADGMIDVSDVTALIGLILTSN